MKDAELNRLADQGSNVAQFVSFAPDKTQRFMRIRDVSPTHAFGSLGEAVRALLAKGSGCVNIRTFLPDKPDGNPFFVGAKPENDFTKHENAVRIAEEMMERGYHVIVNEAIDVDDGGVSGVMLGDIFEFSSRDTPRCVEKPGTAKLSRTLARRLLFEVYKVNLRIPYKPNFRVELSVHPQPVGYFGQKQIIWQAEAVSEVHLPDATSANWPNRYSRDMGDKAFGLLIAHLLDFPVPHVDVFGRVVPHFEFGIEMWNGEPEWIRTCPVEQQPGLYTTKRGWADPYKLMHAEDPDGSKIAALIVQHGIAGFFSGAAITDANGQLYIEGVEYGGADFMQGVDAPVASLPPEVISAVTSHWEGLCAVLGSVRFEWVYDGRECWVVQLHVGGSQSVGNTIFPGEPAKFIEFNVKEGLEALRELIARTKETGDGIVLKGEVGITSHFGDLLRRNEIPSRLEN